MGIKSTYYGLYGNDYTAARARAEMQADALEEVLRREYDRQRELDKQAQVDRDRAQRQYEYEHSVGYKIGRSLDYNDIGKWCYNYGSIEVDIKQAMVPNLPDNADEAREIIEYKQTHGEYPAPYEADNELKKLYQKVIQYRLDGNEQCANNCATRIAIYWRNLVLGVFYTLTNCPKNKKDVYYIITRYAQKYVKPHQLSFMDKSNLESTIGMRDYYIKHNLPIPTDVQAAYETANQKLTDAKIATSTYILNLYNYLIMYNDHLKIK